MALSSSPPPAPASTGSGGMLIGREREQDVLREALTAALAGRGSLVLIGGEAGIGKTTLAEALLAEAITSGTTVLVGRCYDLSETPPYGPWTEVLTRAPEGEGLPTIPAAVLPPERGGELLASQDAIIRRVVAYLAALAARQPVTLLLEDLHWADPASRDLLRVLARQLGDLPLLLLATYRAEEVADGHPLATLLPLLVREARVARLDLRPLDAAAIRALVATRYALPDTERDRLVRYLAGRTEGNALFLGEMLRTLEGEEALRRDGGRWAVGDLEAVPVPPLLRQVIAGRAARLAPEAQRLLAVAAVIGQEVPLTLWAAVGEVAEDALLGHAEAALAIQLLTETPDGAGVRFAHALIREALYAGVPALRRRGLHRRVAEALLAAPDPDPDAVASHLQRAGDPRAAEWLEQAGERAQRAFAWITAAERYEAALALLEAQSGATRRRGWLAFRLGALRRYADARRALEDTEAAGRLAREAGDPLLAGMAEFLAGMLLDAYTGEPGRGTSRMEAGLRALAALPAATRVPPGEDAPLDPTPRWGTIMPSLVNHGHLAEAQTLAERYFAEVDPPTAADWLGGNPYADAVAATGLVHQALGRPEQARAAFARASELYRAVGFHHQTRFSLLLELEVVLRYQADRPAELRHLLAKVAEAQTRAQGAGGFAPPQGERPSYLMLIGHWGEARRAAEAMQAARARTPLNHLEPPTLGWLYREQGESARAVALVAAIMPGGPDTPPGHAIYATVLQVQHLAALLALDAGDLPGARSWLDAHDHWLAWAGAVLGQAEGQLGWAAYHRAAGDPTAARQHAEAALAHASAPRQPLALLAAHRLLGELNTTEGRHTNAKAHLAEAFALAEACEAPYERALTLLALGELAVATGDAVGANAALSEARALLTPLEARPALARADALASRVATAPAPATAASALPFGLSAREVEVLRLVAEGLSDAQVAERLFLSPYTVKAHLRSIYGKTGAENRATATRLAVERGLA